MTSSRRAPRYAAFLRGVMPTNASMPELKRAFERAGFGEVRTLLASGNVVFTADVAAPVELERAAEAAMARHLGKEFLTIVRPIDALREMLAADPYRRYRVAPNAKRVVTFLREPPRTRATLPIELDGARILAVKNTEVFTAYVPGTRGPVFMRLIEKTFGTEQTTRTWDTVAKVAR